MAKTAISQYTTNFFFFRKEEALSSQFSQVYLFIFHDICERKPPQIVFSQFGPLKVSSPNEVANIVEIVQLAVETR